MLKAGQSRQMGQSLQKAVLDFNIVEQRL